MSIPTPSTDDPATIRQITRLFAIWLVARTAVWVVVAVTSHPNAPLDLIEWLSWGHSWQWGYPKHPPLPAWLADAAARLHPGEVWPVILLGYGFTALTLLAAWTLAVEYLPRRTALVSVLCLDGLMYFTNDPAEYSNNVVLNTGWAWLVVATFRAVRSGSIGWWAVVGVVLGLTLLTKYTVGVMVVCLLGWTLWDRHARRVWQSPGLYLAAVIAAGVFAPHFLWARDHEFVTFRYAVERSSEGGGLWARVYYPLQFLVGQLIHLLPVMVVLTPMLRRQNGSPSVEARRGPPPDRFLDFVVLGPVVLLVALSLATGAFLREIWGSPLWTFFGVWLLVRFGRPDPSIRWSAAIRRWLFVAVALVLFMAVKQATIPYFTGKGGRPQFPGRRLADEVNRMWAERYGGWPAIVGGEGWRAGNVVCYSPHRPVVFTSGSMDYLVMDEIHCPWTSDAEVNAHGAAIVWDANVVSNEQIEGLKARFPRFEMQPVVELPWETWVKLSPTRVGVAFVPPNP